MQGLVSGRLDQRRGLLRVKGAIGRDVRLEDVPAMAAKLQQWCVPACLHVHACDWGLGRASLMVMDCWHDPNPTKQTGPRALRR